MEEVLLQLPGFILEAFIMFTIYLKLSGMHIKDTRHPLYVLMTYSATVIFINYAFPNLIGWVLLSLLCMFLFYPYVFRLNTYDSVFMYAISVSLLNLSENIIISVLPVSDETLNGPLIQIIGTAILFIISIIVCYFLPLDEYYQRFIHSKSIIKILCLLLFMLIIADVIIGKLNTITNLITLPTTTASLLISAVLIFLVMHQTKEMDIQKRDIHNYQQYQPMLDQLISDILSKQHDYNNQLQAMKMLAYTHTDYESLSRELINYSAHMSYEFQDTNLLKINLRVLAGFIFSKVKQAQKENKRLQVLIRNEFLRTNIPEYELIRVAGILIDNALDSTSAGKSASLQLDSKENKIILITINEGPTITDELQAKIFKKGYSTKQHSDNNIHGYGLNNLLKITEKYNGEVLLENVTLNNTTHIKFEVII